MIPSELQKLPNWVCHRAKVPINPKTGENASSQDQTTWATYEEAKSRTDVDGIGFVPRSPFCGLDLDHCVDNGVINQFAKDIIRRCNSYTEFSPSGTGIHIILKGDLPESRRTEKIELYQDGNYLTVTGKIVFPARPIRTVTREFLESLMPPKERNVSVGENQEESWVLPALEAIEVDGSLATGRTPTFTRVIGSLKKRGLTANETKAFLSPWSEKYQYGADRLETLVADQYKRYPPATDSATSLIDTESGSISEFMKEIKPVEWIVPGLIAENSINIIAGIGGGKKTWIINDLAIAIASGKLWLDKFPVRGYTCLMVNQERPKVEVQRRFSALLRARDLTPKDLEGQLFIRSGTTTRINLQPSYDSFKRYIEKNEPKVICIDSFNAFHDVSEKDEQAMQFVFEKIKLLRDEFGVTFVFIDHENKNAFSNNLQGDHAEVEVSHDKVRGSGVKGDVADAIFVVRKIDKHTSIMHHTKGNGVAELSAPILVSVLDQDEAKTSIKVVGQ